MLTNSFTILSSGSLPFWKIEITYYIEECAVNNNSRKCEISQSYNFWSREIVLREQRNEAFFTIYKSAALISSHIAGNSSYRRGINVANKWFKFAPVSRRQASWKQCEFQINGIALECSYYFRQVRVELYSERLVVEVFVDAWVKKGDMKWKVIWSIPMLPKLEINSYSFIRKLNIGSDFIR